MKIEYELMDFPEKYGKKGNLEVSWPELVHAAISYGKSSDFFDDLPHPKLVLFEFLHKTYMLYSCLVEENNYLIKSDLYSDMDITEKNYTSYFLGMTMSKLVADRLFNVPVLCHFSKSKDEFEKKKGKSSPDLIGKDNDGNWVVVEAKGTSGNYKVTVLKKAKNQVKIITKINGKTPMLSFGSESYFSSKLKIKMMDPHPNPNSIELQFDESFLKKKYYSIHHIIKEQGFDREINSINYKIIEDNNYGVSIGLPNDLNDLILQNNTPNRTMNSLKKNLEGFEYLGNDGFYVRLDNRWSEENMKKQLKDREE
ncbi:MAG: hypothetical protein M0P12_04805 [Paludibacteraceae bacterium]|nr:hypothetical protein [Paludibacteraceae bacterium]HOU68928.1 hypothetical protein [Paludibacteraceae bacterium]HQF50704.1 hypothetical protein [Paludibacteraceae bacterium]